MPFQYEPPVGPLPILHQDKDVVVVNKPSGLLSVPGRGEALQDSAQTRIAQQFGRVYSVHRLDMDTSGILMFALRRKAERHLKAQFRLRTVQKRYEALVFGDLEPAVGVIELPLAHDPFDKPKSKVCKTTGKAACTKYRVLGSTTWGSRVELCPVTGRSHQLRVHMMAVGHPILGDRFYASGEALNAAPQLQLHATSLVFSHPYSGRTMTITAIADF